MAATDGTLSDTERRILTLLARCNDGDTALCADCIARELWLDGDELDEATERLRRADLIERTGHAFVLRARGKDAVNDGAAFTRGSELR